MASTAIQGIICHTEIARLLHCTSESRHPATLTLDPLRLPKMLVIHSPPSSSISHSMYFQGFHDIPTASLPSASLSYARILLNARPQPPFPRELSTADRVSTIFYFHALARPTSKSCHLASHRSLGRGPHPPLLTDCPWYRRCCLPLLPLLVA